MDKEFTINTELDYFENWLNQFSYQQHSWLIVMLEPYNKWIEVVGPLRHSRSQLNKTTLEMPIAVRTRINWDVDEITYMNYRIRFELYPLSANRTRVTAACLDEILQPLFERILKEIEKLWPESREGILGSNELAKATSDLRLDDSSGLVETAFGDNQNNIGAARRERGPNDGTLDKVKDALQIAIEENRSWTYAMDSAQTSTRTVKKWAPVVLDQMNNSTKSEYWREWLKANKGWAI